MGLLDSGYTYQPMDFGLNSPLLDPRVAKSPLYARAFDRFGPSMDPNSPYALQDDEKRRLFKQGLLQFAAAVSKPNGGNFANALASGLLSARGGMDEGAQQHVNDAYRTDVMQRTRDEMAANTAKTQAYSHIYNPDGSLNQQGVSEVQRVDPQGYLNIHDKLYPQAKREFHLVDTGSKQVPIWTDDKGGMYDAAGNPVAFGGSVPSASPQQPAGQPFFADVAAALSPFGAKITSTDGGEHNPGSLHYQGRAVDIGMGASATPEVKANADRIMADMKARGYVVRDERTRPAGQSVWGGPHLHVELPQGMGAVDSAPSPQTASGTIPGSPFASLPGFPSKQRAQENAPSGYRYSSDGSRLEPIPGGPADTSGAEQDALSGDAVNNMAWSQILEGKAPAYSRGKSGDAIRNKVNNRIADIAKQAGVSPQELATQSGRVKAIQGSLNNLQKRSSMIETQAQTFSKNADMAVALVQKIGQGGTPALNQFKQHLKLKFMGDPNVAAYMAAVQTAQQEYAKIASGALGAGGSTDASRAESRALLDAAYSPDQLIKVVATMKQDIANQKAANDAELADLGTRMTQFGAPPAASGGIDDLLKKYGHH